MADDLINRIARGALFPDRSLDAEIACAIFGTTSTSDDLIYHRVPTKCDQCAPGTYWRKQRSGASLRTSEQLTTFLSRELILTILRACKERDQAALGADASTEGGA